MASHRIVKPQSQLHSKSCCSSSCYYCRCLLARSGSRDRHHLALKIRLRQALYRYATVTLRPRALPRFVMSPIVHTTGTIGRQRCLQASRRLMSCRFCLGCDEGTVLQTCRISSELLTSEHRALSWPSTIINRRSKISCNLFEISSSPDRSSHPRCWVIVTANSTPREINFKSF